jgi:hypothetical protein
MSKTKKEQTEIPFAENAKKIFIAVPLKTESTEKIRSKLVERYGDDVVFADSVNNGTPLESLGKAITDLGNADIVVFGGAWRLCKNCKIMHQIAKEYRKKIQLFL